MNPHWDSPILKRLAEWRTKAKASEKIDLEARNLERMAYRAGNIPRPLWMGPETSYNPTGADWRLS